MAYAFDKVAHAAGHEQRRPEHSTAVADGAPQPLGVKSNRAEDLYDSRNLDRNSGCDEFGDGDPSNEPCNT